MVEVLDALRAVFFPIVASVIVFFALRERPSKANLDRAMLRVERAARRRRKEPERVIRFLIWESRMAAPGLVFLSATGIAFRIALYDEGVAAYGDSYALSAWLFSCIDVALVFWAFALWHWAPRLLEEARTRLEADTTRPKGFRPMGQAP